MSTRERFANDYMTASEAAIVLNKRRVTVVKMCESGELIAKINGGEWHIRKVDVDAFAQREHLKRVKKERAALGLKGE